MHAAGSAAAAVPRPAGMRALLPALRGRAAAAAARQVRRSLACPGRSPCCHKPVPAPPCGNPTALLPPQAATAATRSSVSGYAPGAAPASTPAAASQQPQEQATTVALQVLKASLEHEMRLECINVQGQTGTFFHEYLVRCC